MSGRAPLTDEIDLTDGAHPGFYGPVYLFLMRNIALWIKECLSTSGEGAELHLQKQTPYFKTGIGASTIDVSRATFLPY